MITQDRQLFIGNLNRALKQETQESMQNKSHYVCWSTNGKNEIHRHLNLHILTVREIIKSLEASISGFAHCRDLKNLNISALSEFLHIFCAFYKYFLIGCVFS